MATWGAEPVWDDGRAADQEDLLALGSGLANGVDYASDADRLGLFAGDGRVHEAEHADFSRALDRQYANARVTDHDRHADQHVGHGDTSGARAVPIDQDSAVHLLIVDVDPAAAQAGLCGLVGGAVEVVGKRAVLVAVLLLGEPGVIRRTPPLIDPAQGAWVKRQPRSPTMIVWLVPSVTSLTPNARLHMNRPLPAGRVLGDVDVAAEARGVAGRPRCAIGAELTSDTVIRP